MDFYKKMSIVCEYIPYGRVTTYGQIALLCGAPKNARQVGYALRRELAGSRVPAHRIVNARGLLSGAGAFETLDMQRQLLEGEGVETFWTPDGWRVDIKKYGWKNTMEEALQIRERFKG